MVTSCVWRGCINNSLCTLNFVNSVEPRTGNTEPSQGDTMRGKPIVYETLDTGCIVPTSHKLSKVFDVSFSSASKLASACKWIREWKV